MQFPTFLYHKEVAPEGKIFASEADLPNDLAGWHDTPAKFDAKYVTPPELPPVTDIPADARQAGFVPQPYPSRRYHRSGEERTVANAQEDADLDPADWKDTPDPKAWQEARRPSADSLPIVDPKSAAALTAEQQNDFYKATVSQIVERLQSVNDAPMLEALREAEEANPTGRRPSVLKALKARAAVLKVEHE